MVKQNQRFKSIALLCVAASLAATLVVCLSSVADNDAKAGAKGPIAPTDTIAGQRAAAGRQILNAATQVFQPSLEMKENVDFLLTPALLVQEAMSRDVMITYPSE